MTKMCFDTDEGMSTSSVRAHIFANVCQDARKLREARRRGRNATCEEDCSSPREINLSALFLFMLFSAFLMTSCIDVRRISMKLIQERDESVTMASLRQRHFQAFARRHVSKISRATKESVDETPLLKTSSPVHFSTKYVLAISSKEATRAS